MGALTFDVTAEGPVFDGRAEAAMHEAVLAIRHDLAEEGVRLVRAAFQARIKDNRGVFLSTITTVDSSTVEVWNSSWRRDSDTPGGGTQVVSRVYTMPVVVDDPATETVVTTELATYGPWLEGTGSRNLTTRFRGYHGFRLAAEALDAAAESIAEETLAAGPWLGVANR